MTLPTASQYPQAFDTDNNLFLVRDALRLRLAEDYNPGDSVIYAEGDSLIVSLFPANGIITLTEQCSELDKRAISIHYGSFDRVAISFSDLTVLDGFEDVHKPKRVTNVTLNVVAQHHNYIKDALIKIEEFVGIKDTEDLEPFGETLEGRTNFLRRIAMQPKAWFACNKRTGNVPLEVEFTDMSFRLVTDDQSDDVTITYDFGDQTISAISLISVTDVVPDGNVYVRDTDGGTIRKTYYRPGIYDVSLTVENRFGSDTVVFPGMINARVKAPNDAIIRLIEDTSSQSTTAGVPPNGPFVTTPKIRSPINTLIQIEIQSGENPSTPGYSFAGELLDEHGNAIDPIKFYTWAIPDDLNHPNSTTTKAAFSVGGSYDLKLRVDTQYGAYRITSYPDAFDIVEKSNLWLVMIDDSNCLQTYEYGLISETFKLSPAPSQAILRDYSFLANAANSEQQIREFKRNVGFAPRSTTVSGLGGTAMLYWASGRSASDPASSERINTLEFSGFTGTYTTRNSITRQWNWANLNGGGKSYFVFGDVTNRQPGTSHTNTTLQTYNLAYPEITPSSTAFTNQTYLNGAHELEQNYAVYDGNGNSIYGHFSVYRTCWKDNTGYIVRNDRMGPMFRLKTFYRTEGTLGAPFTHIRKLQDVQGPTKLEGGIVPASGGVFFINNSGSVSKFVVEENLWRTGGPGASSILYRNLQDTTITGFDSSSNTALYASDDDSRAYISFDYSTKAFIRFNTTDLTFSSLGSRPSGEQFAIGVY